MKCSDCQFRHGCAKRNDIAYIETCKYFMEKFTEKYCLMCGTQRCPSDVEAIKTCGYNENYKNPYDFLYKVNELRLDKRLEEIDGKIKSKKEELHNLEMERTEIHFKLKENEEV